MIKNIDSNKIIKTEQVVKGPVNSLSKEIIKSTSKKIILNGGRGAGKSTILHNLEDIGLNTKNQTIYTQFDSIINLSINPNDFFDENFFNHYYELIFSWKLLSYIGKNYPETFVSDFKDIEIFLKGIDKNTNYYIHNIYFSSKKLPSYLMPNEISNEIIARFKKCLNIKTLSLAIDRFDWTNGSSAYTQQLISKYFNLFDKIIITTDDSSLNNQKKSIKLENNGYSFITPTYGKNINIIKEIIRKRVNLYNDKLQSSQAILDKDIMTDEIYKKLINQWH